MTEPNKEKTDPLNDAKFKKKLDQQKEQKKIIEAEQEDLREALKHPASRRVLARIYNWCGVDRKIFNTNAMTMSMQEGVRLAGIQIKDEISNLSPHLLDQFEREVRNVRSKPSK